MGQNRQKKRFFINEPVRNRPVTAIPNPVSAVVVQELKSTESWVTSPAASGRIVRAGQIMQYDVPRSCESFGNPKIELLIPRGMSMSSASKTYFVILSRLKIAS